MKVHASAVLLGLLFSTGWLSQAGRRKFAAIAVPYSGMCLGRKIGGTTPRVPHGLSIACMNLVRHPTVKSIMLKGMRF